VPRMHSQSFKTQGFVCFHLQKYSHRPLGVGPRGDSCGGDKIQYLISGIFS
jgi:hypothetical protein